MSVSWKKPNLWRRTKSAAGGSTIPKHVTALSVSWLNDQFKAVSVHRGEIVNTWERPGLYDGPDKFEEFIREAIRETGYEGQTISVVLAHPRLVQQLADVPPVKGATLEKVIQRQAQHQKIFPGDAAYASQNLPSTKGNLRILLHLFPRQILNQFSLACKRAGLHLTSVLPASAVLQQQLTALPLEKDDVVMLAAETGGSTTVVIGGANGRLLLSRTLQGSWNQDPARLAIDLNRTLLFASQQFNVSINKGLWLFGPGAAESIESLSGQIQFPVNLSPLEYQPMHWATTALQLPEDAPNFITPEVQKAPQRRVFAKVVAAGTTLALAGSIAMTAYSLMQSRKEMATIKSFTAQAERVEAQYRELEQRDTEMKRKQQAIRLVVGDRPHPAPAWLLGYLGQAVPSDLVVTNFSIKREEDFYRMKLIGTHQSALKFPSAPPMADSVEALKSRLAGSPFYVRVLETNATSQAATESLKPGAARIPVTDWLNRITTRIRPSKPVEADHFVIEGILR
jgi:hypothetical protein